MKTTLLILTLNLGIAAYTARADTTNFGQPGSFCDLVSPTFARTGEKRMIQSGNELIQRAVYRSTREELRVIRRHQGFARKHITRQIHQLTGFTLPENQINYDAVRSTMTGNHQVDQALFETVCKLLRNPGMNNYVGIDGMLHEYENESYWNYSVLCDTDIHQLKRLDDASATKAQCEALVNRCKPQALLPEQLKYVTSMMTNLGCY